jgi:hypothetical protein
VGNYYRACIGGSDSIQRLVALLGAIDGRPGQAVCFFWADTLHYHNGFFVQHKERPEIWVEYNLAGLNMFEETSRTREYIFVRNLTPRTNDPRWPAVVGSDWSNMMLRLPACGGEVALSFQSPLPVEWNDQLVVNVRPTAAQLHFYNEFKHVVEAIR